MNYWIPFRWKKIGSSVSVQGYYKTLELAQEALEREKKLDDKILGFIFKAKNRNEAIKNIYQHFKL